MSWFAHSSRVRVWNSTIWLRDITFFETIFYCLCYYSCPNFPPFPPSTQYPPFPPAIPTPLFMSIGCAYKFFGFCISYTILNIPVYFVPINLCFLIPALFCLFSPFPLQSGSHPNNLHTCDSVSDLLVSFVFLDPVDSCEFIAILMFLILIIFFFLNKSL